MDCGILYMSFFHPFKGFWDLKHEKKGNVFSAWVLVASLILLYILRRQMTGFILNFNILNEMNIFVEILSVLVPLGLWCLSNWCITTLVDGEGQLSGYFCYDRLCARAADTAQYPDAAAQQHHY